MVFGGVLILGGGFSYQGVISAAQGILQPAALHQGAEFSPVVPLPSNWQEMVSSTALGHLCTNVKGT